MNGLLFTLGGLMAFRSLWVLFHADRGRKHDLAVRAQVRGQDFVIAMLVPVVSQADVRNLSDLIQCLIEQQYPHDQLHLVVVAAAGLKPAKELEAVLPFTMQWMQQPQGSSLNIQSMLRRAIQKVLASSTPPHLMTVCQPGDLIKPDYLNHMASAAYKQDAFQGYPAFRSEFEESLLSRSLGAQGRLASRVQSVGRFYGGLGVLFGSSGFAFKPSLAEQYPIQYNPLSGFGEWAITLNRFGVPVSWVASVVVYQREESPIVQHVAQCVQHLYRTLSRIVIRTLMLAPPKEIEQRLALIRHNPLLLAFSLMVVGFLPNAYRPGSAVAWFALSGVQLVLWLLQYRVARLSFKQLLNDSTAVLGASFMACAVTPISVLWMLYQTVVAPSGGHRTTHKRRTPKPSFAGDLHTKPQAAIATKGVSTLPLPIAMEASAEVVQPQSQVATIPLLHKGRMIDALLNVHIEPNPHQHDGLLYQLNLAYNGTPFTTEWHPTLEHAYAQLCESLAVFHITPVTCGSCAYLYYPPQFQNVRELEQGLPQHAMCLHGQEGHPPNTSLHPALHVLSKACQQYTDKAQQDAVVEAWKVSLLHEKTTL
jgi:hypothetical protein